jgi:hypothetical protein
MKLLGEMFFAPISADRKIEEIIWYPFITSLYITHHLLHLSFALENSGRVSNMNNMLY